jgi:hypothetical protein
MGANESVSSGPKKSRLCTALTKIRNLHAVCSTHLFGEAVEIYTGCNSRHKPSNSDFLAPGFAPFVKRPVQRFVNLTSGKAEQFVVGHYDS